MGDDLPDVAVMKVAGLALAPSDAAPETRRAAAWVSRAPGGRGVQSCDSFDGMKPHLKA